VNTLRAHRNVLGISQSKLARMSGVSRFKICNFELGEGSLPLDEQSRIREALCAEAERLRNLSIQIEFVTSASQSKVQEVTGV
jgi:predicted transcriptional regulator